MKKDWRKYSWKMLRPLAVKGLQSLVAGMTGPLGWIASTAIPLFIDKLVKPGYQWITRKINKKGREAKGKKKAEEIRDVSTDNVGDIYDSMRD